MTQGTCYENLTIFQTYKMNNEWIKFSCLAENILTKLNPCTIRLSIFYRQPFKNTGILNYDRFIQDFAERSIATVFVCRTGAKRFKEGRIFYKFEISQPHARLVCLPTNIFVLQISALGSGMFLNLLQKRKRSIIHGKTSFFAFPIKTSPSRRKSTNWKQQTEPYTHTEGKDRLSVICLVY